jgi:ABC-type oligopeptide transport system substrate-binding subunit
MGGALLSDKVDYVRGLDPGTAKKVQATPGMATGQFYQSVIHAVWVNNRHKPFDDPRVRRALHLAFDKAVLVDLIQETAPMVLGGFLYPFSAFATPPDKLVERLGYQRDPTAAIKEARQLMAAAGYSQGLKNVDFMVREVAIFKLWADAIQAMLKEALNIETNRRTVQVSVWFDEAQAGNFDVTISAIVSTLLDPSDYFHSWYAHDGPQNYSHWRNAAFEALVPQIDRETDPTQRQGLIRQAEAIFE